MFFVYKLIWPNNQNKINKLQNLSHFGSLFHCVYEFHIERLTYLIVSLPSTAENN